MNKRITLIAAILLIGTAYMIMSWRGDGHNRETVPITEVIRRAASSEIRTIRISGHNVTALSHGQGGEEESLHSRINGNTDIFHLLAEAEVPTGPGGVEVEFEPIGKSRFLITHAITAFLPMIIGGALIMYVIRRVGKDTGGVLGFRQSRARIHSAETSIVTFQDVAGVDEAKQELQEVVEFLKYPERFWSLGAHIPKGILMSGPPGTGKTLLARAVAGEAGVPFFHISGSEFVEMFVGVGAARVRDLFDQAKRNAPSIIFVDEIDAVGRHRGAGLGGGHDEREQTLNQILVEMDGFETNTNIIVAAATNRPDMLDPALLRPGRFDRRVTVSLPDIKGREAILGVHAAGKPISPEVKLETLARETPGFSGADLSNLINEAALLAARRGRHDITMPEFEEAVERVVAGPERKGRVISTREKEMTAYHEAGHALVAWTLPHADQVHKISIVPRGNMGGHTTLLPQEDRYLWTQNQLEDMLTVTMGGRIAEELIFDEVTTGAQNDLDKATKIALDMVKRYGMSRSLGPRTFGKREEIVFLGGENGEEREYGKRMAEEIDLEIQKLTRQAYQNAHQILIDRKPKLVQVAKYLIEHESVSGDRLKELMATC